MFGDKSITIETMHAQRNIPNHRESASASPHGVSFLALQ